MATYNGTNGDDVMAGANNTSNVFNAGEGNNTITAAGSGMQVVNAGSGNDRVITGAGSDVINVGNGTNTVEAGDGNNVVNSGSGNDTITTGSGDDQINAGDGVNVIRAGDGRNVINTGSGNDTITTGSGDDQINAGEGINVILAGEGRNVINTGSGADSITTGAGDDQINAGEGANVILAGDGRNVINTGSGADSITTGSGDDQINAGEGANVILAGDGRNVINTGSGADSITTGSGDDQINAGEGANVILAGDGRNVINTGSGADSITTGSGDDQINAGEGLNVIRAGGGNNTITSGSAADSIVTGSGNDQIFAGEGANTIDAGDGQNSVYAGAGNDTITTGSGNDTIFAGEGANVIQAGAGNNTIYAGGGADRITTGSGSDTIFAGSGADVVNAGGGNDTVWLDDGNDVVRHVVSDNTGAWDVYNGGSGTDTLQLVLTADQAKNTAILSDIARFRATAANTYAFTFSALGLTTTQIEKLELIAPVEARADAATVNEDAATTVAVLANDTDLLAADNSALRVTGFDATGLPGTLTLNGNVFTFVPGAAFQHLAAGAQQQVTFTYTMGDDQGFSATATVTLTVTGSNDGPVATIDSATLAENQTLTVDVLANDTDIDDGAVLSVLSATTPAGKGSVAVVDNKLVFTPGADFDHLAQGVQEQVTVTYVMADQHGAQSTSTVTLTIVGANDAPVAVADAAALTENQTLTVDVLANDTDVDDGAVLSLLSAATPAGKGSVAVVDNKLVFTPGADFDHLAQGAQEQVTVTYVMADQHGAQNASTVTLTVTGTNDGPVAVADSGTIDNDKVLTVDVLANDTDLDDGAQFTLVGGSAPAGKGSVTVVDNKLVFTAGHDFDYLAFGQPELVTLTYEMADEHGARSVATVTVTVLGTNSAPDIAGRVLGTASEDGAAVTLDALAQASDVDFDPLHVVDVPAVLPAGVAYDAAAARFTLDPANAAYQTLAEGESLVVSVAYGVSDGFATSPAEVRWTVTGTNDAPVALADAATGDENAALVIDVLANDSDIDHGAILALVSASAPAGQGSVAIVGGKLAFTPGTDFDHLAAGASAQVVLTYVMADEHGSQATSSVTVTVTGSNDAPVAVADSATTGENAALVLDLAANDTDVDDGAVLALVSAEVPAGKGSVALVDGKLVFTPGADFDHLAQGAQESVVVLYVVADQHGAQAQGTATIVVTGSNDGPVAVADSATTDENTALTLDVLANDTDADDSAALSLVSASTPAGKGSVAVVDGKLVFTPGANFDHLALGAQETVTLTYVAADEHGAQSSAAVTLVVTGTNDAPVVAATSNVYGLVAEQGHDDSGNPTRFAEQASGTLVANDADDGASSTWILDDGAGVFGTLALTADGRWTYTLDNARQTTQSLAEDSRATETFTVTVTDEHGASAQQQIQVTVRGTNDVPVIDTVRSASTGAVTEAGVDASGAAVPGTSAISGLMIASDPDQNARQTWSATGTSAYGTLTMFTDGLWSYRLDNSRAATQALAQGQVVTETFIASVVDDKGAVARQPITVTVTGTNDAPVLTADVGTVAQDRAVTLNVLANDTDPDTGAVLTLASASVAAGKGTVAIVDNKLVYTTGDDFDALPAGTSETVAITYAVRDEYGATSTTTATVTVTGTNDTPVAVADVAAAGENQILTIPVLLNDTDADRGAILSLVSGSGPAGTTVSTFANQLVFNPGTAFDALALGEQQLVTLTYVMQDERGARATGSVTLTVTGTNDAPVITAGATTATVVEAGHTDPGAVVAGTPVASGTMVATDADHGAVLAWSGSAAGTYGAFAIAADGKWTYTLDNARAETQALREGQSVTETFTALVTDEHGATASRVLTVTVTGTNDVPVITSEDSDARGAVIEAGQLDNGAADPGFATAQGTLRASDVDSQTTLGWSVSQQGTYGSLSIDGAGNWTYTLDNGRAATQALREDQIVVDTVLVRVTDNNGAYATQAVSITVFGTNDAPTIGGTATGTVIEAGHTDAGAIVAGTPAVTGALVLADVDATALTVTGSGNGTYGAFAVQANGSWTYTLDNARTATQALREGDSVTETFTVTVTDDRGAATSRDVVVTVKGTNDAPVIVEAATTPTTATFAELADGAAGENATPLAASGVIAFADVDAGTTFTASIATVGAGHPGTITLGAVDQATGQVAWSFAGNDAAIDYLAEGESQTFTWKVTITDDKGAIVTRDLTMTFTGSNDAVSIVPGGAISTAMTETIAASNVVSVNTGVISFDDVDLADVHTVSIGVPQVTASAGVPADYAAAPFGTLAATVVDGTGTSTTGQVRWSYSLNNNAIQGLAAGETVTQVYTLRVSDGHGSTVEQPFTVVLTGTNDAPVIQTLTDVAGAVTEANAGTVLSDTGSFLITDLDLSDSHVVSIGQPTVTGSSGVAASLLPAGGWGTLSTTVSENTTDLGTSATIGWSFAVDSGAIDGLASGQTITQVWPVTISDGHGGTLVQNVTVVLNGSNDAPTILASATTATTTITEKLDGSVGETTASVTGSGAIAFADLDLSNTHTASFTAQGTDYIGTFGINGVDQTADKVNWTFSVNDGVLDKMAAGETLTQVYRVTVSDGRGGTATQDVTVTIVGTNDAPTLSVGASSSAVRQLTNDYAQSITTGTAQYIGQTFVATGDLTEISLPVIAFGGDGTAEYRLLVTTMVTDETGTHPGAVVYESAQGAFTTSYQSLSSLPAGGVPLEIGQTYAVILELATPTGGTPATSVRWDLANPVTSAAGAGTGFVIQGTAADRATDLAQAVDPIAAPLSFSLYMSASNLTGTVREAAEGATSAANGHTAVGVFSFADVDTSDVHTVSITPGGTGYLGELDATVDEGADAVGWVFVASDAALAVLAEGQQVVQTYTLAVSDGHGGVATRVVTITLVGSNDSPQVLAAQTTANGAVTELADGAAGEDAFVHTASGAIAFVDPDHGSQVSASLAADGAGYLGALTLGAIDAATGTLSWSFAAGDGELGFLGEGEVRTQTYTVTLTDEHGAATTQVITVTLTGAADADGNLAPVVSGTATGSVTEAGASNAGTAVVQGTLVATDSDATQWSGDSDGTFGHFAITAAGQWTYTLDNARDATQALKAGQVVTETFEAAVTDSNGAVTHQSVTITVTGANDAPVVTQGTVAGTSPVTLTQTWADNGSAFDISDTRVRLLDGAAQAGARFGEVALDIGANFSLGYDYTVAYGEGTDGLAFVLQADPAGTAALGSGGTGLGALGIANGLALVIDTSNGANFDTIQFVRTSDFAALGAAKTVSAYVLEGVTVHIQLDWNAQTGVLTYTVSRNGTSLATSSVTLDAATRASLFGSTAVYAGVTAASNATGTTPVVVDIAAPVGVPADHRPVVGTAIESTNLPALTVAEAFNASFHASSGGENDLAQVRFTMASAEQGDMLYIGSRGFVLYPASVGGSTTATDQWTFNGQTIRATVDYVAHTLVISGANGAVLSEATVEAIAEQLRYRPLGSDPTQGRHVVQMTVTDTGGASATVSGAVDVRSANTAPWAASVTVAATLSEDGANQSINLLAGATDPEGKPLTIYSVGNGLSLVSASTGEALITPGASMFQYLAAGQTATFALEAVVYDGEMGTMRLFNITVTGTNDVPYWNAATATLTVTEKADGSSGENSGNAVINNASTFGDADNSNTFTASAAAQGAGYLGTVQSNVAQATRTVTTGFTIANGALDSLAQGQVVTQTYLQTIADNSGGTAVRTITVRLVGANDAPDAVVDRATTSQNAPVTLDVVANDTDVDQGAVLTLATASVAAGKGSVAVVDGKLVFDPGHAFDALAAGQSEDVTVTYVVRDEFGATGTAQAIITVTGTNDAPVAVADHGTTAQGTLLTFNPLANDTDIDRGDVLRVVSAEVALDEGFVSVIEGRIVFDPGHAFDQLGAGETQDVVIHYVIADQAGVLADSTVTVTVTGTNDAPVAAADTGYALQDGATSLDVLANDSDLDAGTVLELTEAHVVSGGEFGTIAVVGDQLVFTADAAARALGEGQTAAVEVSYLVSDGHGGTASATLALTVLGLNDDPVIVSDAAAAQGAVTLGEGQPTDTAGQLAGADVDTGDSFSFAGSAQGTYGSFAIGADGAWTYVLDEGVTLAEGTSIEEHFLATLTDSHGAFATQDVVVTLTAPALPHDELVI